MAAAARFSYAPDNSAMNGTAKAGSLHRISELFSLHVNSMPTPQNSNPVTDLGVVQDY